ncbi:MAG: hypothetical protein WD971_03695, partial [Pirellulales bacterium]
MAISDRSICAGLLLVVSTVASAQSVPPTHDDLPYAVVDNDDGSSATLRLDLWLSTADVERAPLVMWIHGGGWQSGTYNSPPPGLQAMLQAGFAVASIQ